MGPMLLADRTDVPANADETIPDAVAASVKDRQAIATNPYPFWAARFWDGMLSSAWLRRAAAESLSRFIRCKSRWRRRFRLASLINSIGRPLQQLVYGRRDRASPGQGCADLHHRSLAQRHHAVARIDGARRPLYVPDDLRVLCAQPLSDFRLVRQASAVSAAHGSGRWTT